jgi:hypothetical protein
VTSKGQIKKGKRHTWNARRMFKNAAKILYDDLIEDADKDSSDETIKELEKQMASPKKVQKK